MKKVFSIIALSAVTLSLSSFTVANNASSYGTGDSPSDCVSEARTLTLMISEMSGLDSPNDNWGERGDGGMLDVYMYYYNDCMGV